MRGQRVGYVLSSFDQNPERQLEGVPVDRAFTDKASGKDVKRPELDRALAFVREGDILVIHSMDRLARNLDDLRRLVQGLTKRGVAVQFVKEGLTFTGEDSPVATLMLSVMGAFAEFERALIRERQREGIALAKQRGAYRGRKKALSAAQIAELRRQLARRGMTVILGARDAARGAAAELAAEGVDVRPLTLDVADPTSVASATAWIESSFGRLDVQVNNAAIHVGKMKSES